MSTFFNTQEHEWKELGVESSEKNSGLYDKMRLFISGFDKGKAHWSIRMLMKFMIKLAM